MEKILVTPIVVFLIILAASALLAYLAGKISLRPAKHAAGERQPYACGEDSYDNKAQPDYSNFFSFAFFFTLAHVATLMITTVIAADPHILMIAAIYLAAVGVGLYILFRR